MSPLRFGKPKEANQRKAMPAKATDYDSQNLAAAKEILADPSRYGGIGAFPETWATRVVARLSKQSSPVALTPDSGNYRDSEKAVAR